jgi:hypothetical protein
MKEILKYQMDEAFLGYLPYLIRKDRLMVTSCPCLHPNNFLNTEVISDKFNIDIVRTSSCGNHA